VIAEDKSLTINKTAVLNKGEDMFRKITMITALMALVLIIASPSMMYAQTAQPVTAIDKIMAYKQGLQLTAKQVKQLDLINRTITAQIDETRKQADICKMEIDEFTANWSTTHGTAVDYIIKEYYDYLAQLKKLELEAIMKARAILTTDQLKRFTELSSIETMMIRVENELASLY
jgi:ABC-type long-subunit fatty acid transport system fused permease/ATPase subunit